MIIKDVFSVSSKILITAPRQFGKSTNINMIKRFLEIEVDPTGSPKPIHTTKNYRLFKDNNLDICTEEDFFNEHFGRHPVVFMDFEPLADVYDFTNMIDMLRIIIAKSFSEHSFLLGVASFKINTTYFDNYESIPTIRKSCLLYTSRCV